MTRRTLIPNRAEADLVCLRQKDGTIEIERRAHQHSSPCPSCGPPFIAGAQPVVAHDRRICLGQGFQRTFCFRQRKFFCADERCPRPYLHRTPGRDSGAVCAEKQPIEGGTQLVQPGTWWESKYRLADQAWSAVSRATMLGPFADKIIPPRLHRREGLEEGASIRGRFFAIWRQGE